MEEDKNEPKRPRPGRPPLAEEDKKHYKQPGLSLRPDQIVNLQQGSEVLNITSRSGVNFGKASWRTFLALIAAAFTSEIIKQIIEWKEQPDREAFSIPIIPGISLTLTHLPSSEPPVEEQPSPTE